MNPLLPDNVLPLPPLYRNGFIMKSVRPVTRRLRKSRRRQLQVELLEKRFLLDCDPVASPLSSAQRQALIQGLRDVATWTSQVADTGQLDSTLPLIGKSVGQAANPNDLFNLVLFPL